MARHYFFLSYARADRANETPNTIERFYKDLAESVRRLTGEPSEEIAFGIEDATADAAAEAIGFLDTDDLKPGDQWPGAVENALRTCRAFVPILSPTYVTRPRCGKEWAVFLNRLRGEADLEGKLHPLILPILLVPPHRIKSQPALVSSIQRDSSDYPDLYRKQGLRTLMKTSDKEYDAFVEAFAERLIDVADKHKLPPGEPVPPLDEITSAFVGDEGEEETKGPQLAAFMFVAGRRDELRQGGLRRRLDNYGDTGGSDWLPYLPEDTNIVAQIATEVATKENFGREFLPLDGQAFDRIRSAVKAQKIVAVLADTWTLRLPPYREQMNRLDETNYLNCLVIVLWNEHDDETTGALSELKAALTAAFPANCTYPTEKFIEVSTVQDLRESLSVALKKRQLGVVNATKEPKRAEGRPIPFPGISGHGGVAD